MDHGLTNAGSFDFSPCRLCPLQYRLPAFETDPPEAAPSADRASLKQNVVDARDRLNSWRAVSSGASTALRPMDCFVAALLAMTGPEGKNAMTSVQGNGRFNINDHFNELMKSVGLNLPDYRRLDHLR
jgi:hypothetical protein